MDPTSGLSQAVTEYGGRRYHALKFADGTIIPGEYRRPFASARS